MKRTTLRSFATCAAATWLLACGSTPAPHASATPTAGRAPTTTAAITTESTTPTTASSFNVIGELPDDLSLFGAGERGFLLSNNGIELQLIGDEVTQDPLIKRGLPFMPELSMSAVAVGGRYPDAFWLSTVQPQNRSGFSTLWRWDGKNWRKHEAMGEGYYVFGIEPWVGGRMLALRQAGMAFDASFVVLSGDTRVAVPELTKARSGAATYCETRMKIDRWSTLPSGEVFTVGQHCDPDQDYQELAVERWAAGAAHSTIDIMPDIHEAGDPPSVSFEGTGIAALSAKDIFVAGTKTRWWKDRQNDGSYYFAHFDGQSWQALAPPIAGGVQNLWAAPGGVVLATTGVGELWSRGSDARWSPASWPAELTKRGRVNLRDLWPRAPGDTWAVVDVKAADGTGQAYLLHTHPAVNAVPTLEAMDRKDRSLRLPGPPVETCLTPFVLLYTLGRNAPADYDYPATRQALKGHPELASTDEGKTGFIEFTREGRRYFGARVPDFKLGQKLAQLVKDKVPGSTPQLVCLDPLDERKLDVDLSAGQLRK